MAGAIRIVSSVVVLSLLANTASAFNGRFGLWRSPPRVAYYFETLPVWCPPVPVVLPVPDAKARIKYAPTTPAPPSSKEPPLGKPLSGSVEMPMIVASHSANKPLPASAICRVGFWNLTGRDVSVTIEGKVVSIQKNRTLTLDLPSQFTWQVEGRPQHVERLADGKANHEVVIQD
jgi:hypothetical protein